MYKEIASKERHTQSPFGHALYHRQPRDAGMTHAGTRMYKGNQARQTVTDHVYTRTDRRTHLHTRTHSVCFIIQERLAAPRKAVLRGTHAHVAVSDMHERGRETQTESVCVCMIKACVGYV
jgi:hypothetical protein